MAEEVVVQQILTYLRQHAALYSLEALRQQLYTQGFPVAEIDAALARFAAEQATHTNDTALPPSDQPAPGLLPGLVLFTLLHVPIVGFAMITWLISEIVVGPSLGPTIPSLIVFVLGVECAIGVWLWNAGREQLGKIFVYGVVLTIILPPLIVGTCIMVI